jgi:hypothetical protein
MSDVKPDSFIVRWLTQRYLPGQWFDMALASATADHIKSALAIVPKSDRRLRRLLQQQLAKLELTV